MAFPDAIARAQRKAFEEAVLALDAQLSEIRTPILLGEIAPHQIALSPAKFRDLDLELIGVDNALSRVRAVLDLEEAN